jgi:hypothetical protein
MKLRRLTRTETVASAVKLLTPALEHREQCRADVNALLDECDRIAKSRHEHRLIGSKSTKKAVKQFSAALKRLRIAADNLPPGLASVIWASNAFAEIMEGADEMAAVFAQWGESRGGKPRREADRQRLAAQSALQLWRGYTPEPPNTAKKGKFCQLAAVLFGDQRADLQHYCVDVLKAERLGANIAVLELELQKKREELEEGRMKLRREISELRSELAGRESAELDALEAEVADLL